MSTTSSLGQTIDTELHYDELIVITGSRIPRADAVAPSPIASFERAELQRFPELNLEEFLNELPQVTPDYNRSSNNPGEGTASVNLRGLGRTRSLVLLNGRRLAPTGTGSAVDINNLPAALVERVELVSGGASMVYGSDAIAGAVNFITRKDFSGVEISAQYDVYGDGDGEGYATSIVAGRDFADGRGQLLVFGDFIDRKPLLGGDREFTETVIGEDRNAGELVDAGSFRIPEGIIFAPLAPIAGQASFPLFNQDGSIRAADNSNVYNFAPSNYLQTPFKRWSGGLLASFALSPEVEVYSELMLARYKSNRQLAPTGIRLFAPLVIDSDFFADSTREILRSTYDPDGDGVGEALFARRLSELGPRRSAAKRHSLRAVVGVKVALTPKWTLEGYLAYDRNKSKTAFENDASGTRILQGLLVDPVANSCVDPVGGCLPVNLFGEGNLAPEAAEFIRIDEFTNRDQSELQIASLVATGELWQLPAGALQGSLGTEYRRSQSTFKPSPVFASGEAIGFTGGFNNSQSRQGALKVYEAFAEVVIPVLADLPLAHRLELEGGARFSHYSTSGEAWTWKLGGQWLPTPGLRFRAMWQRSVRAPNVEELKTNPSLVNGLISPDEDFCRASLDPIGRGLESICIAQGMDPGQVGVYDSPSNVSLAAIQSINGNPNLEPERADSITIGVDYSFDHPITLGADYFDYKIKDAISFVEAPLPLCAIERDPNSNLCRSVTRAPDGFPTQYTQQPYNLSVVKVQGLDLHFSASAPAPSWLSGSTGARLSVRSLATYYFEYGEATTSDTPFVDCAGGFHRLCGTTVGLDIGTGTTFPDRLVTTTFSYEAERLSAALRWRWIGSMDNLAPIYAALGNLRDPNLPIRQIDSHHYLDASVQFNITQNVRLRLGVDNLLETDPPLLGDEAAQSNTDPARYDIYGRRFFLGIEAKLFGQKR